MSCKRNANTEIVFWKDLAPARRAASGEVASVRALADAPVARNVENRIVYVAATARGRPGGALPVHPLAPSERGRRRKEVPMA